MKLVELNDVEVTYNKDTIQSLKDKLEKMDVNVSNMSDEMVLNYAEKMDDVTIESKETV